MRSDFAKRAVAIRAWIAANKTVSEVNGKTVTTLSSAYRAALSEKKALMLDNIQAVLSQYVEKNADGSYTVKYNGSTASGGASGGGNTSGGGGTSGGGDEETM